jgi:predicted lysophospholipase L1 biosynthesis ABC-type transport system permease subunit
MAGVRGAIGLLLAVMDSMPSCHTVTRRTRESACEWRSAPRADVLRLVMRDGMRLSLIGIAAGLLIAVGIGFVMSLVLPGVAPVDAAVLASVTALLIGVSALACYAPGRRAARVDPMIALRSE